MTDNRLFDEIDSLYEGFLKVWIDVCNIESPTDYKEGVDKVVDYFAEFAMQKGWKTEIFPQDVAGNCLCVTMNPESGLPPIALSGHIDTVHAVGSFGNPAVSVDDVNIYGPGAMDCKGGTVAALLAMTALHNIGFKERPVQLLLQTDEESNSLHSNKATINFMCEKAKNAVAFLNCESIKGNTAVLWRRGICRYRFDITGKTIHASKCNEGASAIYEAAEKIVRLEKFKDINGITCNCGIISGGNGENIVPEKCSFFAEIRFNTTEEFEMAQKAVKEIAETSYVEGTACVLTETVRRCAMEKSERNFLLLDKMNEIYRRWGLPELTARQSLGGSDAADITAYGIPCVDSIGVAGDYIHTRQEYAVLKSLKEAAKRVATVIYSI